MLKLLNIISLIIILLLLFIKIYWYFWVHYSYKFKKGDPIACPHYKNPTYYLNKRFSAEYDFYPYFNTIQKNLEKDKTIEYYQWIFYYNENKEVYEKTEFWCVYKTGLKNCEFRFNANDIFFIDKKGILHLCNDLIDVRIIENHLTAEYYKLNMNKENKNISEITKIYSNKNKFIGHNINVGHIRHEIRKRSFKQI